MTQTQNDSIAPSGHHLSTPFLTALLALALALGSTTGCGGPRMKQFLLQPLDPLPANTKIDAYMGKISPPYIEVAVIESDAFAFVDDGIKLKQLEQLKKKARQLGANTVQDVHMMAKHVQGYTIDERVPFTALQQGKYELYFLRAQAVKTPEPAPASLEAARPKGGWVIERFAPPPLRK